MLRIYAQQDCDGRNPAGAKGMFCAMQRLTPPLQLDRRKWRNLLVF